MLKKFLQKLCALGTLAMALALVPHGASAQNFGACPYPLQYGQVLTAAQWNACLSFGINALPLSGGTMTGRLVTAPAASGSLGQAGFNLPPGIVPNAPANGDVWTTVAGMFVRINGLTVGPLAGTSVTTLGSVGALRAGNFGALTAIQVTGWNAGSSSGGGWFAIGGCAADNGITCFKDSGNNYWQRLGMQTPVDISMAGAKSDGLTTVGDLTVTSGTNTGCSASRTFTSANVGQYIELNPADAQLPWQTTILSVNGNCVTFAFNSPINYPGVQKASQATMFLPTDGGPDNPGSGWRPLDTATAVGGTFTSAAQLTVIGTGLVGWTQTSGGTLYTNNDILTISENGNDANTSQKLPAQIQVQVGGGGAVTSYVFLHYGIFQGSGSCVPPADCNPTGANLVVSGGTGSGYAFTLLANDGSFGITKTKLLGSARGSYTVTPPNPIATTLAANSPSTGTNGTADFVFSSADYTTCTDDTAPITTAISYAESIPDSRGLSRRLTFPDGSITCGRGWVVSQPEMWSGSGPKSTRILCLLGAAGQVVNGAPPGCVVGAIQHPANDDYQQSGYGQPQVSFNNLSIYGMSTSTTGYIDGSGVQTFPALDILEATNPVTGRGRTVPFYVNNVEIARAPGDLLAAYNFDGEFRTFGVTLLQASGYGLNMYFEGQPAKFVSTVVAFTNGVNIYKAAGDSFQGLELFNNNIGMTVTGYSAPAKVMSCAACHFTDSVNEGFYDDATNLKFECGIDCDFFGNNTGGATSGASDSDIVIGPDAGTSKASGTTQSTFEATGVVMDRETTDNAAFFTQDANNNFCNCFIDIDGSYIGTGSGTKFPIVTNHQVAVHGRDLLGPLLMNGNAVSFGSDMTSATPCLVATANNNAINAQLCDGSGLATVGVGQLNLKNGFSSNVQLQAPNNATTYAWKVPPKAGLNNQVLAWSNGASAANAWADMNRAVSTISNTTGQTFAVGGNWTIGVSYLMWDIERSGPTAGFTDTFDTAANIIAGVSGAVTNEVHQAVICNSTAFTETLAAGTGDTLAGTTTVAAGTCLHLGIRVTGAATVTITGA